ncbi:MAG: C40 family peptidase [Saprospiraceae bacterium]
MIFKCHILKEPFRIKNLLRYYSLPLVIFVLVMSSCASNKSQSHYSSRNSKKERVKKSRNTANTQRKSTKKISSTRAEIVRTAKKYIGKPYKYGGKQPVTGFDCSGFTAYVYNENGLKLGGPSYLQAKKGEKKSKKDLEVGDLVFFGTSKKVTHVGIVASVDSPVLKIIHSTSSRGVVIDDISNSDYWQKRYLFGRDILR